jgi:hypothetical protein
MQTLAEEQYDYIAEKSGDWWERLRVKYQTTMNYYFPRYYPHSLYELLSDPDLTYSDVLKIKRKQNNWYYFGRIH